MEPHDPLTQWEIRRGLRTRYLGRDIVYFAEVTSTQDHAKQFAKAGAHEGTLIVADHQTAGRGRLGRSWFSPPGVGIHMTLILRPPQSILTSHLTLLSAVAAAAGLREATSLPVQLKWANDLMLQGKKVGGILIEGGFQISDFGFEISEGTTPDAEIRNQKSEIGFAVIGIGINVNTPAEAFPEELRETATSLLIESGQSFRRADIVREILHYLEHWYERLKGGETTALLKAYKALDCILGKEVVVTQGGQKWEGMAEDIADDGALLLRTATGKTMRFIAGEVKLRAKGDRLC